MPVALTKLLLVRPSSFARLVMSWAKEDSEPPSPSASTTEASLPDWMITPRTRSSTRIWALSGVNIFEPWVFQACWLTGSVSSIFNRPAQHLSVQAYCPEWRKGQAQPHELDDAPEP